MAERDVYGRNWLDETCARREFAAGFVGFLNQMPAFAEYYRQLKDEDRRLMHLYLEASGRQDDRSRPLMNSYYAEGMASTLQYVEVLFSIYDRDLSGYLDAEEAQRAFPVFRPTLQQFSGQNNPRVVEAIFTYLLKHGHAPEQDRCGTITSQGLRSFGPWLARSKWEFQADRTRMLQIFAEILRLSAPKPEDCGS